jgi:hypothetical protein
MAGIGLAALKAKSKADALTALEQLDRPALYVISQALGLHVKGSRNTLITSIIVKTHPAASKRPCGCPEPVVAYDQIESFQDEEGHP